MEQERKNILLIIVGTAGSGKTTSAIQYLKMYKQDISDRAVFAVNPGREDKLFQFGSEIKHLEKIPDNFSKFKNRFFHFPFPEPKLGNDEKALKQEVIQKLSAISNCLFWVDDAGFLFDKNESDFDRLVRIRRQRNNDIILIYHSIFDIPPGLDKYDPVFWIHRGSIPLRKRDVPKILEDIQNKVNQMFRDGEEYPSIFFDPKDISFDINEY